MSNCCHSNLLHLGTGAQCSVLLNYLHPLKIVKEICPNFNKIDCIEGLVTVKQDTVTCRERTYEYDEYDSSPILHSQVSSWQHVNMFVSTKRVIHLTSGVQTYLTAVMLLESPQKPPPKKATPTSTMKTLASQSSNLPRVLRTLPTLGIRTLKSTMTTILFLKISPLMAPRLIMIWRMVRPGDGIVLIVVTSLPQKKKSHLTNTDGLLLGCHTWMSSLHSSL